MGWNSGYKVMEKTVIDIYNSDLLTAELLNIIMKPYKDTDCDSGGSRNLKSKDGLGVEQIICKVMKPNEYKKLGKDIDWANDDDAYDLFNSIWSGMWKIW